MRSANDVAKSKNDVAKSSKVSEMGDRDEVTAENGINMERSDKKSVRKTGSEDSKASDGGIEKDNISQEKEKRQSFETQSGTGVCNATVVIMTSIHCIQ